MEKIKKQLKTFLESITQKTIASDGDNLIKYGILDSFTMIELINFIEETFKVEVDMEEISPSNFNSINSISELVNKWSS